MSAVAPLQAVLFDLDGTLIDTAPDMAAALNRLRREHGLEPLPYATLRPYVSRGSNGLLDVGFGKQPTEDERAKLEREEVNIVRGLLKALMSGRHAKDERPE